MSDPRRISLTALQTHRLDLAQAGSDRAHAELERADSYFQQMRSVQHATLTEVLAEHAIEPPEPGSGWRLEVSETGVFLVEMLGKHEPHAEPALDSEPELPDPPQIGGGDDDPGGTAEKD